MKRNNRNFTIIELMIVVSILVILMAILLPALNKVRKKAQTITCLNNQRQLGIALQYYVDSSSGYYPYARIEWVTWHTLLYRTGILTTNKLKPNDGFGISAYSSETFRCPSWWFDSNFYILNNPLCSSYGINTAMIDDREDESIAARTVKFPARTILLADTHSSWPYFSRLYNGPMYAHGSADAVWPDNLHPGVPTLSNNHLFFDNHAETRSLAYLYAAKPESSYYASLYWLTNSFK